MPVVEAEIVVPVPPDVAFAVSQLTGDVRRRWDPFIRSQHHIDGAIRPGKGVRTATRSRHGLRMVSEYVSFAPPSNVGMKMVEGPWFFEMFAGGWRFAPVDDGERTPRDLAVQLPLPAAGAAPDRAPARHLAARARHPAPDRGVRGRVRRRDRAGRGPGGERVHRAPGKPRRWTGRSSSANVGATTGGARCRTASAWTRGLPRRAT